MKTIIETIKYKGFDINIVPDEFCDSPDNWSNDDYFLVYDHRDFYVKKDGFNPDDIFETMQTGKKTYAGYFYFPVYAYIHSGICLQLKRWFSGLSQGHNSFDVSFKGFALIKKTKGSYTMEKAYKIAQSVIDEWNDYLSGNVYGFEICRDECIHSIYGFYGDYEKSGIIDEAKSIIDYELNKNLQNQIKQLKIWIKNHVPFETRQKQILKFA